MVWKLPDFLKCTGTSGIVVEMIRAAGDVGASMIRDLEAAVIRDCKLLFDWEQRFIVWRRHLTECPGRSFGGH